MPIYFPRSNSVSGVDFNKIIARGATTSQFPTTAAGLQAALNSLPVYGGEIMIPDVTISGINGLTIPTPQVMIRGCGNKATILQLTGTIDISIAGSQQQNFEICDLTIDGGNNSIDGISNSSQGDNLKSAYHYIHDLEIKNFKGGSGSCINLKNHETTWICRNYIHGANGAPIRLYASGATGYYAGNIHIFNNMLDKETITDPNTWGLAQILLDSTGNAGKEMDNYNIYANHFYGTGNVGQYGIVTKCLNGKLKHIKAWGNRCEGSNFFKTIDNTYNTEYLKIFDNHIEQSNSLDSILLSQADSTHGVRFADVHDNTMSTTKVTDANTEYAKPNMIHHNIGGGVVYTVTRATIFGDNYDSTVLYGNPRGKVTNPFNTTDHDFTLVGNSAAPTASQDYTVRNGDIWLVSSGGTGVSITIKDANGTTIYAVGGATFNGIVHRGELVNFGAYSVAPTLVIAWV